MASTAAIRADSLAIAMLVCSYTSTVTSQTCGADKLCSTHKRCGAPPAGAASKCQCHPWSDVGACKDLVGLSRRYVFCSAWKQCTEEQLDVWNAKEAARVELEKLVEEALGKPCKDSCVGDLKCGGPRDSKDQSKCTCHVKDEVGHSWSFEPIILCSEIKPPPADKSKEKEITLGCTHEGCPCLDATVTCSSGLRCGTLVEQPRDCRCRSKSVGSRRAAKSKSKDFMFCSEWDAEKDVKTKTSQS